MRVCVLIGQGGTVCYNKDARGHCVCAPQASLTSLNTSKAAQPDRRGYRERTEGGRLPVLARFRLPSRSCMSVLVLGVPCTQLASTDKIACKHVLASSICRGRGQDMHVVDTSARHKVHRELYPVGLAVTGGLWHHIFIFLLQYYPHFCFTTTPAGSAAKATRQGH